MARLNKFASMNLNDSYGKPDRGGSANNSSNGSSSAAGKPRISSSGGMLILSRPGRSSQPSSPSAAPSAAKPGQARLGIPSPVNLPSLKRETSACEALSAQSPPIAGWSKGESPPLTSGWIKGESSTNSSSSPSLYKAGLSKSLDAVGENVKAVMSTGKSDVYAPPAMRAATNQAGSTSRVLRPPTPPFEKSSSAIIRGEEFPTLQAAAAARPPTPPQHPRQKDLQQKQRDKHHDAKQQQAKLQQLYQAPGNKQVDPDNAQAGNGNHQSESAVLSLRPLGKPENAYQKGNPGASGPDHPVQSYMASAHFGEQGSNDHPPDSSLSRSPPARFYGPSQSIGGKGGSAVVDRSLSRSPPRGVFSPGNPGRVNEAVDSGHNLRPQYRNLVPVGQSSPNVEERQFGFQTNSESSWLSLSWRDHVPLTNNSDHSKAAAGEAKISIGQEMGRVLSEMRSTPLVKESYFNRDSLSHREGNSGGVNPEDVFVEQGGFARDCSDFKGFSRSSSLLHDDVPRIEGFHSQRLFGRREVHSRVIREGNVRVIRESGSRDSCDTYDRDSRGNRENFSRDNENIYDQDVKEAYSQDSRNPYARDIREVYNQDPPQIKQPGYGYSSNTNGDSSWRGHSSYADRPNGRGSGSANSAGILPSYNQGSAYDTHAGKPHGSHGIGDQSLAREALINIEPRAVRGQHAETAGLYSSASEMLALRSVRSPGHSSSSFDRVKEVHEVHPERLQNFYEGDRLARHDDKVMDVKGGVSESYGSNFMAQRPVSRRESTQGFGRTFQVNINRKLDDERSSREDAKKQLALEDERRKEAAKLKLMELEERIARRAAEGRKDEVEVKGKEPVEVPTLKQQDFGQSTSNTQHNSKSMIRDGDSDIAGGEGDLGLWIVHPSSATSVSSRTYRTPGEGFMPHQVQDSRLVGESELNQEKKVVRSRSPGSWRKEIGGGPTSKLFSSPYIESGSSHRPIDGGTYKLF